MRRCRHAWQEVRRYFAPPPTRSVEVERATPEYMRALAFGMTVVELRCRMCSDVTSRELPGNATGPEGTA